MLEIYIMYKFKITSGNAELFNAKSQKNHLFSFCEASEINQREIFLEFWVNFQIFISHFSNISLADFYFFCFLCLMKTAVVVAKAAAVSYQASFILHF